MIDLERKNPQWLYDIDDDEKTAIRGSFKSLVESFNSIKKDYSDVFDSKFVRDQLLWMKKELMDLLPDARFLSSVPVYRLKKNGVSSIKESDGLIQVGFISFDEIKNSRFCSDGQFWECMNRKYSQRYSPADTEYEIYKCEYEDPKYFPFIGLTKEALVNIAEIME